VRIRPAGPRMAAVTSGCRRTALAVGMLAAVLVLAGAPAAAHEGDPRLVTVLDEVVPGLPPEVVLQVQAGLATQLVASNPTPEVLEVLGREDRPFLRLSSAGVLADVAAPDFYATSNPSGAVPDDVAGGSARWVQISAGDSWGWYDHRLHPERLRAPADEGRTAELADFEVPLRYGQRDVAARGRVVFQPLLGSFEVTADPAPADLTVSALPGRLPGVFLSAPPGVTVLGRDDEPFLRFTAAGVEVNAHSRTHVEDRQARGLPAAQPSPQPAWMLTAPGARSYTWLDARLRYPADLPPDDVLRRDEPTVVQRWEVPVLLGDQPQVLSGDIRWVPEAEAAARAGAAPPAASEPDRLPWVLLTGAVLLVLVLAVGLRRRRAAHPAGPSVVPRHTNRAKETTGREEPPSPS
jgi:hypothetical protein